MYLRALACLRMTRCSWNVCMYVCMHACVCMWCVHMYPRASHAYTWHVAPEMYVCMQVCICVCISVYKSPECLRMTRMTRMHMHMHIHIHTHTHLLVANPSLSFISWSSPATSGTRKAGSGINTPEFGSRRRGLPCMCIYMYVCVCVYLYVECASVTYIHAYIPANRVHVNQSVIWAYTHIYIDPYMHTHVLLRFILVRSVCM